jgi:hypothetical protein
MEEDELEAARVRAAAERRDHGRKRIREAERSAMCWSQDEQAHTAHSRGKTPKHNLLSDC